MAMGRSPLRGRGTIYDANADEYWAGGEDGDCAGHAENEHDDEGDDEPIAVEGELLGAVGLGE
jgi:hypothetical protein